MAGTFDPEQEARIRKLEGSIHTTAKSGNINKVVEIVDQLISLRPGVHRYYGLKVRLLRMTGKKDEVRPIFSAWAKGCAHSAEGLGDYGAHHDSRP